MASFLLLPVKAGNRLALGAFWGEGRSLRLRSICLARAVNGPNPRLMLGADGAGRGFGVVVVVVAVTYGIMEVTFPHNLSNSTINIKVLQHTLQY